MLKLERLAIVTMAVIVCAGIVPLKVQAQSRRNDIARGLAGVWKAQEYKVALGSELDIAVWGKGASRVRNVELAIEPDGDGVLKVFTSVVDPRGKTKQFSASVVEAQLGIAASDTSTPGRVEPKVTVLNAEERFLDGSGDKWPIEGLTVKIHAPALDSPRIELRYDTRQGRGSFGETLARSQS